MNQMPFVYLLLVFVTTQVHAFPTSKPNCATGPGINKNIGLIHKVVLMGKDDDRQTIQEYAAANGVDEETVRKQFAATGMIECGPYITTIQLSGAKNMVTAASHAFHRVRPPSLQPDPKNPTECSFFKPTDCKVRFPLTGSNRVYKIKENSMDSGGCPARDIKADWAFFELTEDVSGATPYALPPAENKVPVNLEILQVAYHADNFRPGLRKTPISHYNFIKCKVRSQQVFRNASLHTDCDTGGGTSGAGQLVGWNDKIILMAISVGYKSNLPDPNNPNDIRPAWSDYNTAIHSSVSVPLEGEFLRKLRERVNVRVSGGH